VRFARALVAFGLVTVAVPSVAGPPYLTDDPAPTDTGHWEIYGFTGGEGHGSALDEDLGFDLNYGPVKGVQLTATIPLSLSHESLEGWRAGSGDLEFGVKYRFLNDEKSGFSAAIFPRIIFPTAAHTSDEKTRLLLPLWVEKDFKGGTRLFGGGGYEINPGIGNRNFWEGGIALTQDVSKRLSVGVELTRQGPEADGGTSQTRAGIGTIIQLSEHYALLFSGGPTWADHQTSYRFYAALGLNF
jgi:hypothetical protein